MYTRVAQLPSSWGNDLILPPCTDESSLSFVPLSLPSRRILSGNGRAGLGLKKNIQDYYMTVTSLYISTGQPLYIALLYYMY